MATVLRGTTAALLCLAGLTLVELVVSEIRFVGPTTAPLRILAWPTSEGSTRSTIAIAVWIVVGIVTATIAQHRDLAGG